MQVGDRPDAHRRTTSPRLIADERIGPPLGTDRGGRAVSGIDSGRLRKREELRPDAGAEQGEGAAEVGAADRPPEEASAAEDEREIELLVDVDDRPRAMAGDFADEEAEPGHFDGIPLAHQPVGPGAADG